VTLTYVIIIFIPIYATSCPGRHDVGQENINF